MDFSKYMEIKRNLAHYDARLETLRELKIETLEKRQEVCDNCSHDFVFIYRKESKIVGHPNKGVVKHAECLVCGKHFQLDNILMDNISEEQINEDYVLDFTGETSEFSQMLFRGNKNVLLLKAKEIFDEYCKSDTTKCLREVIENDIYDNVLELDKYYVDLEEGRKQKYRESLIKKK